MSWRLSLAGCRLLLDSVIVLTSPSRLCNLTHNSLSMTMLYYSRVLQAVISLTIHSPRLCYTTHKSFKPLLSHSPFALYDCYTTHKSFKPLFSHSPFPLQAFIITLTDPFSSVCLLLTSHSPDVIPLVLQLNFRSMSLKV
jgi:hypothetical protein